MRTHYQDLSHGAHLQSGHIRVPHDGPRLQRSVHGSPERRMSFRYGWTRVWNTLGCTALPFREDIPVTSITHLAAWILQSEGGTRRRGAPCGYRYCVRKGSTDISQQLKDGASLIGEDNPGLPIRTSSYMHTNIQEQQRQATSIQL